MEESAEGDARYEMCGSKNVVLELYHPNTVPVPKLPTVAKNPNDHMKLLTQV